MDSFTCSRRHTLCPSKACLSRTWLSWIKWNCLLPIWIGFMSYLFYYYYYYYFLLHIKEIQALSLLFLFFNVNLSNKRTCRISQHTAKNMTKWIKITSNIGHSNKWSVSGRIFNPRLTLTDSRIFFVTVQEYPIIGYRLY